MLDKSTKPSSETIDVLIDEMSDAKVFSKIDLKETYIQIEPHGQSIHLTNFVTEHGVYVLRD